MKLIHDTKDSYALEKKKTKNTHALEKNTKDTHALEKKPTVNIQDFYCFIHLIVPVRGLSREQQLQSTEKFKTSPSTCLGPVVFARCL